MKIIKGKKGRLVWDNWPELLSFFLLIVGFILGITAGSAFMLYLIALVYGAIFGRLWVKLPKSFKIPVTIIVLGALVGLVAGSIYGDRKVVIIIFIIGYLTSYYIHDRNFLHSTEY